MSQEAITQSAQKIVAQLVQTKNELDCAFEQRCNTAFTQVFQSSGATPLALHTAFSAAFNDHSHSKGAEIRKRVFANIYNQHIKTSVKKPTSSSTKISEDKNSKEKRKKKKGGSAASSPLPPCSLVDIIKQNKKNAAIIATEVIHAITSGADLQEKDGSQTLLELAIRNNQFDTVKALLFYGITIDAEVSRLIKSPAPAEKAEMPILKQIKPLIKHYQEGRHRAVMIARQADKIIEEKAKVDYSLTPSRPKEVVPINYQLQALFLAYIQPAKSGWRSFFYARTRHHVALAEQMANELEGMIKNNKETDDDYKIRCLNYVRQKYAENSASGSFKSDGAFANLIAQAEQLVHPVPLGRNVFSL